ncbi:MAG: hypothetical protein WD757_03175 [Actinomycetota bacterium]
MAKIDPATGAVVASVAVPHNDLPELVAGDAAGTWILTSRGQTSSGVTYSLHGVNPQGTKIVQSVPLGGIEPKGATPSRIFEGLAVDAGSVWLIDLGLSKGGGLVVDGYIIRVSARSGRVTGVVSVGHTNTFAVSDGAVWTSNGNGRGIRIDAKTLKVTELKAESNFEPFAVEEGGVWFMVRNTGSSHPAP